MSPGSPALSLTRRGICPKRSFGSDAVSAGSFASGEEGEFEEAEVETAEDEAGAPLGTEEAVDEAEEAAGAPLVAELVGLGPALAFAASELEFVAAAVAELEGAVAAPETSIVAWKLPCAESPDGPLMPRNNRPAMRTFSCSWAPTRNGCAASSEPIRPISAPLPAEFTGRERSRSLQLRAAPCGPVEPPSINCSVPVAVTVTDSPGAMSTPVSAQGALPGTSSSCFEEAVVGAVEVPF